MDGVLFSWVLTGHLEEKFLKSSIWAKETMNVTWSNNLGKVVFLGLSGIQILKVSYMSYRGNVFESLTNKIQSFQRFQNLRRFRVFVLSYRANW